MSCDPNFSQVSLLLHFDGSNGGTTFTDSSSVGNTVNTAGAAALSTAEVMFGTASMEVGTAGNSANGANVVFAANGPLDLSTGDFTVEGWFYIPSVSGVVSMVFSYCWPFNANTGFRMYVTGAGIAYAQILASGAGPANACSNQNAVVPSAAWTHFAVVRQGASLDLFIGGVSSGTGVANISNSNLLCGTKLSIGYDSYFFQGSALVGYIDEFRVTKGLARYTPGTSFTPPASAFGGACAPSGGTVYGAFAPLPKVFKPIALSNLEGAIPRIWPAYEDKTVRIKP